MEYRSEVNNFDEMFDLVWGGAIDVMKDVKDRDMEEEFMNEVEWYFESMGEVPTLIGINDYIRHEWTDIYESMGVENACYLRNDYPALMEMIEADSDEWATYFDTWEDALGSVYDFQASYPTMGDYIEVDEENETISIDYDISRWFY